MTSMTTSQRERFLADTRLGILCTIAHDGSPRAVPVWFEWNGTTATMFTEALSPKIARLRHDPGASLLVTNAVGETEQWVSLDGEVEVHREGALELAERLAQRYWDVNTPKNAATLESWRQAADQFVVLELKPERIRSFID